MTTGKHIGAAVALTLAFGGSAFAQGQPMQQSLQAQPGQQTQIGQQQSPMRLDQLTNQQVQQLQTHLQQQGYYRAQIDGIVGPNTQAALQQYFQNQGLFNQAQLASRGQITEQGLNGFGIDEQQVQRVAGQDPDDGQQQGGMQPQQFRQQPQQLQQQPQQLRQQPQQFRQQPQQFQQQPQQFQQQPQQFQQQPQQFRQQPQQLGQQPQQFRQQPQQSQQSQQFRQQPQQFGQQPQQRQMTTGAQMRLQLREQNQNAPPRGTAEQQQTRGSQMREQLRQSGDAQGQQPQGAAGDPPQTSGSQSGQQ